MTETAEVKWLSEDEQQDWRAFLKGTAKVFELIGKDLNDESKLSFNEYKILVYLSESPDYEIRMSDLADHLVNSRSRLTHTVHRLETAGYVERRKCPHDKRGIFCKLTPQGFAVLEEAAPKHVMSVRRHLVDRLSAQEFRALGEICGKLLEDGEDAMCS